MIEKEIMLISEKRLRKLIIEEITSEFSGPIDDDSIIISDDSKCFFGSRRRDVPPGRLRTTGDGRGFALNDVMVAIMDHPSLADMRMTDLDWEIMDEEWFTPGSREAVSVVGRGCFKDCEETDGTSAFMKYCHSLVGDDEEEEMASGKVVEPEPDSDTNADASTHDTGNDFEPVQDPEFDIQTLSISAGDGESLSLNGLTVSITDSGKLTLGGTRYSVTLKQADRQGQPDGPNVGFKIREMTIIDESTINVDGLINMVAASMRRGPDKGNQNVNEDLPVSALLDRQSEIESGEDEIVITMTASDGTPGFIYFRR